MTKADRPASKAGAVQAAALALFAERGYRGTTMDDIGLVVGLRGPSLYRHVRSKQALLAGIMVDTMTELLAIQEEAVAAEGGPVQVVRRMVEGHVRFHAGNREKAFVGNREIGNLTSKNRAEVLRLRDRYEDGLRSVILAGADEGVFPVRAARLASYAILDMGIGVSAWFRADGPHGVDEVAYAYADFAISLLRAGALPQDHPAD